MARHVFIVSRDQAWLHGYLVERFAGDPNVTVILDRRTAPPGDDDPGGAAFRATERRVQPGVESDLATQGYVIIDI